MRLGKLRFEAKYLTIQYFHEKPGWSIRWMCTRLGISKAAYYKWIHRNVPEMELENQQIAEFIIEYEERFHYILGYRRMTNWINRLNGTHYSRKRVHRIMKELNIHSVNRTKRKKYQSSTPEITAENILKRDFTATRQNEKWATDVTEFKWYEGVVKRKLFLSAIVDLYDRSIISYVLSRRNDNKIVFDTFEKVVLTNPDAKPIFHSERGFQYTSEVFQEKVHAQEMTQSMPRVGRCVDN